MLRRTCSAIVVAGASLLLLVSRRAEAQSAPPAPEKIAVGEWQLAPTLEVRVRGEYRRDAPNLGGSDLYGRLSPRVRDAWVVMERSRIGIGAERGAVRAQITLQDARALGTPPPNATFAGVSGIGRIEPYEAFAEMRSSGARPNYFRIGRQAVVWGEGRLIGNADFSPTGRALDAARGHLAVGNFDFEALAAILEVPGPLGSAFGDTRGPTRSGVQLYGLLAKWTLDPLLKVEAYGLLRMARGAGNDLDGSKFALSRLSGERYTLGLRVSGEAKGWSYGAEGAYQLGTASAIGIGGNDISAWAAYAHVAKTLDQVALTPTLRVAGSYASGDSGSSTVYRQFDPLLADPQRFHGQMDLFAWSNHADVAGRVQIAPWTDTTFGLEYRYARLVQGGSEWIGSYLTAIGRSATGQNATDLGHELNVVFAWRPWLPVELRAGWSGLLLGDGAKETMAAFSRGRRNDDNSITPSSVAHYAYAQMTVSVP